MVMTVDGDVIAAHSHWTDDRSRIVTDATVLMGDGQEIVVSQLGGSVDDIGMITVPGPVILEPGMRVAVVAHADVDLAQRTHVVLDSVKVLAYPPGFVRMGPTAGGHYLRWESGCVFVTIDAAGTTAISDDAEFPAIDAAIATWNATRDPSCSYLEIRSDGRAAVEVGYDRVNVIKFRDTVWGRPASGNDPAVMYSPSAAGMTTLSFVNIAADVRDGVILDADIELNGVNFAISLNGATAGTQRCHVELQNNLTHELGRLLGLENTCLADNDPPRLDDQGNPVPLCASTSDPRIFDATMYNFQDCGETKKETLTPDDIQAMCQIYPAARDPGICDRVPPVGGDTAGGDEIPDGRDGPVASPGGCTCHASTGELPDATLLLAGAAAMLAIRGRRRQPAPS